MSRWMYYMWCIWCMILSGCIWDDTFSEVSVVVIEGYGDTGIERRGHWWYLDAWTIITAGHVVDHDWLQYRVGDDVLRISYRDVERDITVMHIGVDQGNTYSFSNTHTGALVSTRVFRDDSWHTLTGVVISPSVTLGWYDRFGHIRVIHEVVLTNLPVMSWESGAPIFDAQGNIVGIVMASHNPIFHMHPES